MITETLNLESKHDGRVSPWANEDLGGGASLCKNVLMWTAYTHGQDSIRGAVYRKTPQLFWCLLHILVEEGTAMLYGAVLHMLTPLLWVDHSLSLAQVRWKTVWYWIEYQHVCFSRIFMTFISMHVQNFTLLLRGGVKLTLLTLLPSAILFLTVFWRKSSKLLKSKWYHSAVCEQ